MKPTNPDFATREQELEVALTILWNHVKALNLDLYLPQCVVDTVEQALGVAKPTRKKGSKPCTT